CVGGGWRRWRGRRVPFLGRRRPALAAAGGGGGERRRGLAELLDLCSPGPGDVFCDLGSGVGRAVLQATGGAHTQSRVGRGADTATSASFSPSWASWQALVATAGFAVNL
ncbi:unnamed protein product, partial [Prorocentrum cordatum]